MNAYNVKDFATLLETSNKAGWVVYLYKPTPPSENHDGSTYTVTLKLGDPHEVGNGHGCVVIKVHTAERFLELRDLCEAEFGEGDDWSEGVGQTLNDNGDLVPCGVKDEVICYNG